MDVDFYLYFRAADSAEKAGETLKAEGYSVEVRLGADDVNGLALASRSLTEEEFDTADQGMTEVAESLDGEYDGYERGVANPS